MEQAAAGEGATVVEEVNDFPLVDFLIDLSDEIVRFNGSKVGVVDKMFMEGSQEGLNSLVLAFQTAYPALRNDSRDPLEWTIMGMPLRHRKQIKTRAVNVCWRGGIVAIVEPGLPPDICRMRMTRLIRSAAVVDGPSTTQ